MTNTTKLNFTTCPCCGEVEYFGVHADERIYGQALVTLKVDDTGKTSATFFETTEMYWDTSTTVDYFADCCGKLLPDDYQDELDRLLGTTRESDPNWS